MKPVDGTGISFAEPVLLDSRFEMDPDIIKVMEPFLEDLKEYKVEIANTTVYLHRNGSEESNIGNLVSDATRDCWPDTTIAVQNNGGIR